MVGQSGFKVCKGGGGEAVTVGFWSWRAGRYDGFQADHCWCCEVLDR